MFGAGRHVIGNVVFAHKTAEGEKNPPERHLSQLSLRPSHKVSDPHLEEGEDTCQSFKRPLSGFDSWTLKMFLKLDVYVHLRHQ